MMTKSSSISCLLGFMVRKASRYLVSASADIGRLASLPATATLEIEHGGTFSALLALSSAPIDRFSVHYSSDPLLGFHLAPAFRTDEFDAETLAQVAKTQFKSGCRNFAQYTQQKAITIYLHHGDAVNLCYKLQKMPSLYPAAPTCSRPWMATPLVLDSTTCHAHEFSLELLDSSRIGLFHQLNCKFPHIPSFCDEGGSFLVA